MSFLTAVTAVTGGLTAFGQMQQAKQAQSVANYNASVYNQQADAVNISNAQEQAQLKRQKKSYISTLNAQYAFRGVQLSGSPLLCIADQAAELETDIQTSEFNARVEENRARSQANILRAEGRQVRTSGFLNAGTTLLKPDIAYIKIDLLER